MDEGNSTTEILQTFLRIKAIKKEKSVYERADLNHHQKIDLHFSEAISPSAG